MGFFAFSRPRLYATAFLALLGVLVLPVAASAAEETFHRFEVEATANYTITEQCADGSTATTRVTVIGGHEEESVSGEQTLENDFLTVLLRGVDCEGSLINDRGSGPAEFTYSPGLDEASVTGTITTREGRTVAVDMDWEGAGALEVTNRTTLFPGFKGHFQNRSRDAIATGTVIVDGETLVDGSTTTAEIESLEDRNTTTTTE